VRSLREAKGWTMADLARHSGVTASQLRRLELAVHAPRRPLLEKLARALEVEFSDLVR
jgi:transcriptional regulator with XRE-family HTH domain